MFSKLFLLMNMVFIYVTVLFVVMLFCANLKPLQYFFYLFSYSVIIIIIIMFSELYIQIMVLFVVLPFCVDLKTLTNTNKYSIYT